MELVVLNARSSKKLAVFNNLTKEATVADLKKRYHEKFPDAYTERQSFRTTNKGKSLKDTEMLKDVCASGEIYYKDLGPQIGWSTVFYAEYAGPLFVYLMFYFRLPFIYGSEFAFTNSDLNVVHVAAACHSFHYMKRLLETKFIHRFSHGTMPIANLFKNCSYYWTFAAWQAYLINNPLYSAPSYGDSQVYIGLGLFGLCQLGNFSIHLLFKNLRKEGSTERKIPIPDSNPMTLMFNFVSCPNYMYEIGSWISFTLMTQCTASFIFACLGFYQMAVWALGKHRNYKKEFHNYPRSRKAIVPFIL